MKELTELPATTFDTKLKPFFVAPLTNFCIGITVALHTATQNQGIFSDGLFDVYSDAPVKIGCTIPLPHLGLFVQLAQLRPCQRIVPCENAVCIVFDNVLNFINVCVGDGKNCLNVIKFGTADQFFI